MLGFVCWFSLGLLACLGLGSRMFLWFMASRISWGLRVSGFGFRVSGLGVRV